MGFTTGFTGGVTLTLSIAYFTVLSHQRNRQQQCDIVHSNASVLHALTLARPAAAARLAQQSIGEASPAAPSATMTATVPTTTPHYFYQAAPQPSRARTGLVDELKDRWNAEVAGAVRRVQTTDWSVVREDAELTVASLWTRVVGGTGLGEAAGAATAAAVGQTTRVCDAVKAEAKELQSSAAAASSDAKILVSQTVEKVTAETTDKANAAAKPTGGVEKALKERYTKPIDKTATPIKSVGELLDERYKQNV